MLHKPICDMCVKEWAGTFSVLLSSESNSQVGEKEILDSMLEDYNKNWAMKGTCNCPPGFLREGEEATYIFDEPPPECPFRGEQIEIMKLTMEEG